MQFSVFAFAIVTMAFGMSRNAFRLDQRISAGHLEGTESPAICPGDILRYCCHGDRASGAAM